MEILHVADSNSSSVFSSLGLICDRTLYSVSSIIADSYSKNKKVKKFKILTNQSNIKVLVTFHIFEEGAGYVCRFSLTILICPTPNGLKSNHWIYKIFPKSLHCPRTSEPKNEGGSHH